LVSLEKDALHHLAQNSYTECAKLTYNLHKDRAILCVKSGEFMVFPTGGDSGDHSAQEIDFHFS
jgi:hypothetical protein